MDDVFAGDIEYPVVMTIGKWHDGRLTEQTEMLPDCVSDEIAVIVLHRSAACCTQKRRLGRQRADGGMLARDVLEQEAAVFELLPAQGADGVEHGGGLHVAV